MIYTVLGGFSGGALVVKNLPANTGDVGLIPGSGRSLGVGNGIAPKTWAFLVAQTVKTLPAMQENWVRSLGWENPLKKGMAIHSSMLAWRIPMDRRAWWATVHRVAKSRT